MILSHDLIFILRYQIYNYNGVNKTQFNILVYNVQVAIALSRTFLSRFIEKAREVAIGLTGYKQKTEAVIGDSLIGDSLVKKERRDRCLRHFVAILDFLFISCR